METKEKEVVEKPEKPIKAEAKTETVKPSPAKPVEPGISVDEFVMLKGISVQIKQRLCNRIARKEIAKSAKLTEWELIVSKMKKG